MKLLTKFLIILASSVIVVGVFIPMGIYHYLILVYTDYHVIRDVGTYDQYSKLYSIKNWKIVNTVRENYVFPDDKLEYQLTFVSPIKDTSRINYHLETFKGGGQESEQKGEWVISGNKESPRSLNFFLKEEGSYDVKIDLIFYNDTNGEKYAQKVQSENIQVQSLSNKLLDDANKTTFFSYMAIFATAVAGNLISIIYLRKQQRNTGRQLSLTQKELESRLRAELEISVMKSNLVQKGDKWIGMIEIIVKNNGSISARNVKVHFKDPTSSLDLSQLIRDENEIKSSYFPIPGSIPAHYNYPEQITHNTTLDEPKVYDVAVWVTYDYGEVRNMEFIQIVKVNNQSNSEGPLYEKEDIDREKNRLKNQGL